MKRRLTIVTAVAALALATAACGGADDETSTGSAPTESTSEETTEESTPTDDMTTEDEDEAMAGGPVGPGCADFATAVPDGEGSVEGMSDDPVATAASNNPILTTLTAAVSGGVNPGTQLVDTLNGGEFTVFAPVDDAFAALPAETLTALGADDGTLLTTVLTYHVVPGQMSPDEIAGMSLTSVQGGAIEVAGEPDALTVNGANVICGGVMTANATVYLIDQVLSPPAAG